MMKQLKAYDYGLAALLAVIFAVVGVYTISVATVDSAAYETELRALGAMDARLNRDLYRLESGELRHYDSVVSETRALRRIDSRLARVPAGLGSDQALGKLRLEASIMLSEKLVLVEDFKTALAEFRAAMDFLPELSSNLDKYASASAGLGQEQFVAILGKTADYIQEPSPDVEIAVRGILEPITQASEGAAERSAPGHAAQRLIAILDSKKTLDTVRRDIAGVHLAEVSERLAGAFAGARNAQQWKSRLLFGAVLATLLLLFSTLAFIPRWQLGQKEVAAVKMEEVLRTSLQEARAQSDHLKRDEQAAAARLAEERHIALVRHAFDIMAIVSRQDHYIYITPSCHALFGLTEKELIGKSVYEGIHADDLIKVQDYFIRAQKELQMDQTIQYRVMDAYGGWHLVESFASNQANNPAVRGMVLNTRRLQSLDAKAPAGA